MSLSLWQVAANTKMSVKYGSWQKMFVMSSGDIDRRSLSLIPTVHLNLEVMVRIYDLSKRCAVQR